MRITLVCPFDPRPAAAAPGDGHVGGVERVFAHVAAGLARRGHRVTIVCSTDGPAGRRVEDGVRFARAHRRGTLLRAPLASLADLIEPDADVVQVAATYPFTTPRVLRRAKALGVPAVLDFHFEPAPGTLLGRAAAAAYRRLGPRSYPLADAVLVRSLAYARSCPSLRRVPRGRWHVVPNGIDVQRFRPNGPPRGEPYVLFVGRLVPYKGVETLLRALQRARLGVPLVVVGDGPLRPSLQSRARAIGVDARFLGHVPDEELPGFYRGARATVLPSVTRQEAFGITLLESMACGTPVVASDLPGVRDLARLGGLLARPGAHEDLAQQLRRVMGDDVARGPELASRIHRAYSWEAVTDRMLAVYDHVLKSREGPSPTAFGSEVTTPAHPGRDALL